MYRELNPISYEFKRSLEHNNIRGCAMTLEFGNLGKTIKTNAKFTSSDINTCLMAIQLLNGGSPIILDESSVVYANIERPDGTLVTNKVTVIDGSIGVVAIHFNSLATEIDGTATMDITVRHLGNEKVVSPKVSFVIYESNDSFYEAPEDSEVNILDVLVDEVVTLKNTIINTNSVITQDAEERKVIEAEYDAKEAERRVAELERQLSIKQIEEAEAIRVEQELERQDSMKNISEEFTNKVTIVNNKVALIDSKLSELSDNESERQAQHSARVEEFDNVIKADHEAILEAEASRVAVESERVANEEFRKEFFNEFKAKDVAWTTQEETRVSQEASRVNSFKNMTSTFDSKVQIVDGKISTITEKISEATKKITQFSNDEATRKSEHSARVNKFDNEIVVKHQEMISEENKRVTQESARVIAENERKNFYAQTQTAEASRVTADEKREEKVRTLEARVDSKIDETSNHVRTLEDRVNAKINEYNTATLITNAEIDTIIANALK